MFFGILRRIAPETSWARICPMLNAKYPAIRLPPTGQTTYVRLARTCKLCQARSCSHSLRTGSPQSKVEASCASVSEAGGAKRGCPSATKPRGACVQNPPHASGLCRSGLGVHPVQDLLKSLSVCVKRGLLQQNGLGLLESGGEHELRPIGSYEAGRLINYLLVLPTSAQVDVNFSTLSGANRHATCYTNVLT
jgi:hypothetical protein